MSSANSTADRAIDILLLFDEDHPILSATEVAKHFKMARSTAYRYLTSLRAKGLIVQKDEGFGLGHKIFVLARAARVSFDILDLVEPELKALQKKTGETILFVERRNDEIVVLESIESKHPMRITYGRGAIFPFPAGASARIFVAFSPNNEVNHISDHNPLNRYTNNTIVDPVDLQKEIDLVRRRGYAVNHGEIDDGVSAISAPILNKEGYVEYAVTVVGPSSRITTRKVDAIKDLVCETAKHLSSKIFSA